VTYRCPSHKHICINKEINRDYLDSYVISLLEREVFNKRSLKSISKKVEDARNSCNVESKNPSVAQELEIINEALQNVADAVASGLISDALIAKLQELERQKTSAEQRLKETYIRTDDISIDTELILSEYHDAKESPHLPGYRDFISNFIDKITVGKYVVDISLKTGLDICPELNTSYIIRRQEIYEQRNAI